MLPNMQSDHPSERARGQHRRQASTPSAAHTARFSPYPSSQQRRQQPGGGHKRGMSLDARQIRTSSSATTRQDYLTTPTATNLNTNHAGLATIPQHHVLREAQQQCQQARPGSQSSQQAPYTNLFDINSNDSNFLMSPHGTPQSQTLDSSCFDPSSLFESFSQNASAMMANSQLNMAPGMSMNGGYDLYNQPSPLSTPNLMGFSPTATGPAWASDGEDGSHRSSRRISNGIANQVSKFERLGMEGEQRTRASTPPILNPNAHYFPITPTDTPNDRASKGRLNRFSEGYDESMEETIKPSRKRGNPRNLSIFLDAAQNTRPQSAGPSPPGSATFMRQEAFSPAQLVPSPVGLDNSFMNQRSSSPFSSHRGSPSTPHQSQFADPFGGSGPLSVHNTPQSAQGGFQSLQGTPHSIRSTPTPASLVQSPSYGRPAHSRNGSVASVQSAASIADINFDEAKTETGVTMDDIAVYIEGPDLADGKWTCIYEGCGKKFGRKENIKSHVQTHLNDRQFQCPTCQKCFVRQHDLKRHAKIHTGVKPYPCDCGNTFARHDALTRHRQRGMCVGAFDGIVRRTAKRGRPRKNGSESTSERRDKKTKARRKNASTSSASSQSGYTDSSAVTTPGDSNDLFNDMLNLNGALQQLGGESSSSAPMPTATRRPASDGALSPSIAATTPLSYVSPHALMTSDTASERSHINTPSPGGPSQEAEAFLTMDPDTSATAEGLPNLTASSSIVTSASLDDSLPIDFNSADPSSYMSLAGVDESWKFDEMFNDTAGMYAVANEDDLFGE